MISTALFGSCPKFSSLLVILQWDKWLYPSASVRELPLPIHSLNITSFLWQWICLTRMINIGLY